MSLKSSIRSCSRLGQHVNRCVKGEHHKNSRRKVKQAIHKVMTKSDVEDCEFHVNEKECSNYRNWW